MINEYINNSIRMGYHHDIDWYIAILSKSMINGKFRDGDLFRIGDDWVKMETLALKDKVTLEKDIMPSVTKEMTVSFGRFIFNALCVDFAFDGAIPFIDKNIDVDEYVNKYILKLSTEMDEADWTAGLFKYSAASKVMGHLVPYAVISETKKLLHPAPGTNALKKKVMKELKDKYGEDAFDNLGVIAEYEERLGKHDAEYLKSEVDKNVVLAKGGKPTLSRKKTYASFGVSANMVSSDISFVVMGLAEGTDLSPKEFAKKVNDIRSGSSSRGKDTQIGGVIAAILTRSLHAYNITVDDCKTDDGFKMLVGDDLEFFVGSNILLDGKVIGIRTIEDIKPYINKEVIYRTFLRCKANAKEFRYCKVCAGINQSLVENGIALVGAGIGGVYLNILMKQMHDQTVHVTDYDMKDMFT